MKILVAVLAFAVSSFGSCSTSGTTFYVSPAGNDTHSGTSTAPWKTIGHAILALHAGDTLIVKTGNYYEKANGTVRAGTNSAPVLVAAEAGAVLHGQADITGASWWTFSGLNVTWQDPSHPLGLSKSNWMVRLANATHWRWTGSDLGYPHSTAAIGVGAGSTYWQIDHCVIHNNARWNDVNQDHLIYVQSPANSGGLIERNIIAHSSNGRGVKVGENGGTPVGGVTVRYNTFYDNLGPTNIQLSYGASNVTIYRNILVKSAGGYRNVVPYNLSGSGNTAHDNIGWQSAGVVQTAAGLSDTGGNRYLDPQFADLTSYRPTNSAAVAYGRWA